jgi:dTDP-4-dehydrorhamnose reductase
MTSKKVLVLGAGGMLGHMMVRVLSNGHDVAGTTRGSQDAANPLARFLRAEKWIPQVDVRDDETLSGILRDVCPDVVINCIGLVKQKMDNSTYIDSIEINSLLPHRLASMCSSNGSKLIQMSTDCVFTCDPGVKTMHMTPNATDLYGRTKLLGEVDYEGSLTIRSSIVGKQLIGSEGLFEWVIAQNNGVINGYRNALYTGVTTMAMAKIVDHLISTQSDLTGIWQIASRPISKYDLVDQLINVLGLNIELREDVSFICDRRLDGSSFTAATGIEIPTWSKMLSEFAADQVHYG